MFVYLQQFYHHRIIIYHNLTENIIYLSWQDVWKTISCWSKNYIFVSMFEELGASYSRNASYIPNYISMLGNEFGNLLTLWPIDKYTVAIFYSSVLFFLLNSRTRI